MGFVSWPVVGVPFSCPAMAGDVNLFLNDPDGNKTVAEIEIMVAEKSCRRRGFGKEALLLMMQYGESLSMPLHTLAGFGNHRSEWCLMSTSLTCRCGISGY